MSVRWAALIVATAFVCCACSDSKSPSRLDTGVDGGVPSGGNDAGEKAPVAFNGDCSTARWGHATDACWSCLCGACKDTVNLCGEDCTAIIECAATKHTLVNVNADLACEVRATTAECVTTPAAQAAAQALVNFDGCLLSPSTPRQPGEFRACDTVCKTVYPGDVCQRYPAPPAM